MSYIHSKTDSNDFDSLLNDLRQHINATLEYLYLFYLPLFKLMPLGIEQETAAQTVNKMLKIILYQTFCIEVPSFQSESIQRFYEICRTRYFVILN